MVKEKRCVQNAVMNSKAINSMASTAIGGLRGIIRRMRAECLMKKRGH